MPSRSFDDVPQDPDRAVPDSGAAKHGDDPRAEQEFRLVRPKHLREDRLPPLPTRVPGSSAPPPLDDGRPMTVVAHQPPPADSPRPSSVLSDRPAYALPPGVDPWDESYAASILDSTLVGEILPPEPEPDGRRPRRRAWLAVAATMVAVAGAASFAVWGQPSTADSRPDTSVIGTDDPQPQYIVTGSPAVTRSPGVAISPSRGAVSGRTGTPTSTAATTPAPSTAPGTPPSATTQPAPPPPPSPTTQPPVGPTKLPVAPHTGSIKAASGLCLDNYAQNTFDGNPTIVWACNTTDAQRLTFGADGTLRVRGGGCIRPKNTSAGALVEYRSAGFCDSLAVWYFRSDKVIVNNATGRCLTNSGVLVNNLPQLTITTCTAASAQQWTFS